MRLIWNAGTAFTITTLLTAAASLGSDPALLAVVGAGSVQVADPFSGTPASAALPHRHYSGLSEHFQAANPTHDGRLTAAQAGQAGWTRVARHFYAIDGDHAGFVTQAQIHAYNVAHRRTRKPGDDL